MNLRNGDEIATAMAEEDPIRRRVGRYAAEPSRLCLLHGSHLFSDSTWHEVFLLPLRNAMKMSLWPPKYCDTALQGLRHPCDDQLA